LGEAGGRDRRRVAGAGHRSAAVDFYDVDGIDYFGECTIYSVSGLLPIRPQEFDFAWGATWDITKSSFFGARVGWPLRLYRWALANRPPHAP
jgi:hypothetical protein